MRRAKVFHPPEKPKAHDEIPDSLGIGVLEERTAAGELMIFLKGSRTTAKSSWIILGKYAEPQDNGKQYYVADRTETHWADIPVTTYHEHLLTAVARIYEIYETFHSNDHQKGLTL